MDKLFEKASNVLSSTAIVAIFTLWLVLHTLLQKDYISFISELAIWIGLLILRAENVQAERMEKDIKKDLKKTKEVKKEVKGE